MTSASASPFALRLPAGCVLARCCAACCAGAAGAAPARSLRFEQLSVEHGLAQESILAIVQDGDGFMWFGSQTGLSRFDGYRVTTYRNEVGNPRSLVNNWVRVLHVDRAGRLWIGTDGGLDRFDPATQTLHPFRAERAGQARQRQPPHPCAWSTTARTACGSPPPTACSTST